VKLEIEDIQKDWKKATEGLASWRTETKESYEFAASRQWDSADIAKLEEEERPAVTFDRIGVFIDAVCGMEINNRQTIKYFPVEQGDIRVNDMLTNAVKYYENDCGAEDEDSEAARDAVICGVGATETVMATERHPDGAPTVLRRDPLSTWFDPDAYRRNLADKRFFFYGDWLPHEDAKERWPDANFSSEPPDSKNTSHFADRAFEYKEDGTENTREGQVFILHYQCWKKIDIFRLKDPETGKILDFETSKFKLAKEMFRQQYGIEPRKDVDYVKSKKKCYYRAFVSGNEILEQDKLPVDDFTFKFITFKRDRNKRCWYGLLRVLKDPQRWANKWLSQILHIVNTNAKGGAFVEQGALTDPRKTEEQWAQANPLILLKEGGIDKIRERNQSAYPSGLDKLMQFAFNALPMVSGMNLEVLGLADREQAGVVESQRRQSAFTILAPLFAAIREYRRARGRLMLGFLKVIPQGTLVRIVGDAGEQWVPLAYDRDSIYDVKIDQAPDSPDYKKQVWEALAQILPAMMKAGYPIPPEVLTFSPLPPDVSEKWLQWIKEQGWMPPEQKAQMEQMQQQLRSLGEENMKLKEGNMMLRLDHSTEVAKLQIKQQDGEDKNAVKVYQAQLASMNAQVESSLKSQKNEWDMMLKAFSERMKAAEIVANERVQSAQTQVKAFEAVVKAQGAAEEKKSKRKINVKRVKDGVYQIEPDGG
jgi:hypothetical protein